MRGKLFGIGVGPGDPELMTLKAVKTIKQSSVVITPTKEKETSVAYEIASQAVDLTHKEWMGVHFPMTKDLELLEQSHQKIAQDIQSLLDQGKDVAFLTLGDPTVYATYIYIHQILKEKGYEVFIVPGIPSFCATAAKLNISLVERSEQLHVIPASYSIEEALQLPGTKVFLKAGSKMKELKSALMRHKLDVYMVENCGMKDEKVYYGVDNINENAGYYATVIVKEKH